ncbi:MAG: hypothetical protein JKY49_13820 [Cohaesibacteraceae bacterium]|nr:hypothetical protein [Cohaesibacteraceae bacterium]
MPGIISTEHEVVLYYQLNDTPPEWDGSYTTQIDSHTERLTAIVKWVRCYQHMFGSGGEYVAHRHPLAERGFGPFGNFEVTNSSWKQTHIEMNKGHYDFFPGMYDDLRHFLLPFHDSTFECLAKGFEIEIVHGSSIDIMKRIIGYLDQGET